MIKMFRLYESIDGCSIDNTSENDDNICNIKEISISPYNGNDYLHISEITLRNKFNEIIEYEATSTDSPTDIITTISDGNEDSIFHSRGQWCLLKLKVKGNTRKDPKFITTSITIVNRRDDRQWRLKNYRMTFTDESMDTCNKFIDFNSKEMDDLYNPKKNWTITIPINGKVQKDAKVEISRLPGLPGANNIL